MADHLAQFISNIRNDGRVASYTPVQLKQSVILKVLHLLGWDAFNAAEVMPDFNAGTMIMDYALHAGEHGSLFLHIVSPLTEKTLDQQERAIKTAAGNNVRLAVLTDGLRWHLYTPLPHAPLYDKEFCRVDFTQGEPEELSSTLKRAIGRRIVMSGTAFARAEKIFNDRLKRKHLSFTNAINESWERVLNEAASIFVELIAIEAKRLGTEVEREAIQSFYAAFTKLATAPEVLARKTKYETTTPALLQAWSNVFKELEDFFVAFLTSEIERTHEFHPDSSAVQHFIAGKTRLHESACGALLDKRRKVVEA
jgi:hypothetical protein